MIDKIKNKQISDVQGKLLKKAEELIEEENFDRDYVAQAVNELSEEDIL